MSLPNVAPSVFSNQVFSSLNGYSVSLKGLYYPWLDNKSNIHHTIMIKMHNLLKNVNNLNHYGLILGN